MPITNFYVNFMAWGYPGHVQAELRILFFWFVFTYSLCRYREVCNSLCISFSTYLSWFADSWGSWFIFSDLIFYPLPYMGTRPSLLGLCGWNPLLLCTLIPETSCRSSISSSAFLTRFQCSTLYLETGNFFFFNVRSDLNLKYVCQFLPMISRRLWQENTYISLIHCLTITTKYSMYQSL